MCAKRIYAFGVPLIFAGLFAAAAPADAPRPKDYGYGATLLDDKKSALLLQLQPNDKGDPGNVVTAKVLADVHGKIKAGAIIKIYGPERPVPFAGGVTVNLPAGYDRHDKDVIYVWPVQQ